jgi:hypothetical protein
MLIIIGVGILVLFPYWFLAVATTSYVIYGLALAAKDIFVKWRSGRHLLDEPEDDEAEDVGIATDRLPVDDGPRPGR